LLSSFFFFFQAEDGIRYLYVTGVQTCALPISPISRERSETSLSAGGTSPRAIRRAKPSTTAVFPTPASPVRMGLFCRRRMSTSKIGRASCRGHDKIDDV